MKPDMENLKKGKVIFNETKNNNDYSGLDFTDMFFESPTSLTHGFFNGVTAIDCVFDAVPMDQCEFAEAHFTKIVMKSVKLSGSDFVGTRFEDVIFEDCDFTNGEWRDSQFTRVAFTRCIFKHTTINLCVFNSCSFCSTSTQWLDHSAVNYNVFTGTTFSSQVNSTAVISKNFGLPGNGNNTSLIVNGVGKTLEEVCISSANGFTSIPDFVDAIENEFMLITQTRMKKLRLEFISNIISSMAHSGAISASSMIYIEKLLYGLAQTVTSESDLRSVMSAILIIRNALFESAMDLIEKKRGYENDYCNQIVIRFEKIFDRADADELAEALSYVAAQNSSSLIVTEVEHGSTIMKIIVSAILTVPCFLDATNSLLRQASVTVRSATDLKRAVYEYNETPLVPNNYPITKQTDKIPAIMKNGAVLPEYGPVRDLIEKSGKKIIRFDEKAEVIIHSKRGQVMQKKVK
jgi:uncharacterized protein YjbI with pentapeptide repeats